MTRGRLSAPRYDARQFCESLVSALVKDGVRRVPLNDERVEQAFGSIIDAMAKAYLQYYESNRRIAYEISAVIDSLSPNSNTGALDAFWSTLRDLQPGAVRIGNPEYLELEFPLDKHSATARLNNVPNEWRNIVESSAQEIEKALGVDA